MKLMKLANNQKFIFSFGVAEGLSLRSRSDKKVIWGFYQGANNPELLCYNDAVSYFSYLFRDLHIKDLEGLGKLICRQLEYVAEGLSSVSKTYKREKIDCVTGVSLDLDTLCDSFKHLQTFRHYFDYFLTITRRSSL